MSIVAPRTDTRQARRIPTVHNLVPTAATRALAAQALYEAEMRTGPDAALLVVKSVAPDQVAALLGILLSAAKVHKKLGRPQIPVQLSPADRRRMHTLYKNGVRTPEVLAGEREYQRVNQRNRRARRKAAA